MSDDNELKRWALNSGKQVTLSDGTIFNAAKQKVEVKDRAFPHRHAKPEQKIENEADALRKQLAEKDAEIARLTGALSESKMTALMLRQAENSGSKATKFRFSVTKRDERGFIKDAVIQAEGNPA